jgi:hypothetical protein
VQQHLTEARGSGLHHDHGLHNYDARTRHTNADFYESVSEHDLQRSSIVMAIFAYQ